MYFVYDPNGDGLTLFNTEDEAKDYAYVVLKEERQVAEEEYGEWSLDIEEVCWGKVFEKLEEVDIEEDDEAFIEYEFVRKD